MEESAKKQYYAGILEESVESVDDTRARTSSENQRVALAKRNSPNHFEHIHDAYVVGYHLPTKDLNFKRPKPTASILTNVHVVCVRYSRTNTLTQNHIDRCYELSTACPKSKNGTAARVVHLLFRCNKSTCESMSRGDMDIFDDIIQSDGRLVILLAGWDNLVEDLQSLVQFFETYASDNWFIAVLDFHNVWHVQQPLLLAQTFDAVNDGMKEFTEIEQPRLRFLHVLAEFNY